mmetsp:Transcript_84138/g.246816  ORF Transcript_84138/g.246816 Transcript_84138/m.246816 type:complete len:220 (-) Transcript_84138:2-661(-)
MQPHRRRRLIRRTSPNQSSVPHLSGRSAAGTKGRSSGSMRQRVYLPQRWWQAHELLQYSAGVGWYLYMGWGMRWTSWQRWQLYRSGLRVPARQASQRLSWTSCLPRWQHMRQRPMFGRGTTTSPPSTASRPRHRGHIPTPPAILQMTSMHDWQNRVVDVTVAALPQQGKIIRSVESRHIAQSVGSPEPVLAALLSSTGPPFVLAASIVWGGEGPRKRCA